MCAVGKLQEFTISKPWCIQREKYSPIKPQNFIALNRFYPHHYFIGVCVLCVYKYTCSHKLAYLLENIFWKDIKEFLKKNSLGSRNLVTPVSVCLMKIVMQQYSRNRVVAGVVTWNNFYLFSPSLVSCYVTRPCTSLCFNSPARSCEQDRINPLTNSSP